MASQARIYVLFSSELKARLNNRIDLQEILATEGIDADVEWHAAPPTDPSERTKVLVETVALASLGAVSAAAAIKVLESAITHYLDHKAVRDCHYAYWVNEPVLDGSGRAISFSACYPRGPVRDHIEEIAERLPQGVTVWIGGAGVRRLPRLPTSVLRMSLDAL